MKSKILRSMLEDAGLRVAQDIRSGDIALFPSQDAFWLLRLFVQLVGMKYYHAGLLNINELEQVYLYEAVWPHVTCRRIYSDELAKLDIFRYFAWTEEIGDAAVWYAQNSWAQEEPYSIPKAVLGGLNWIWRKLRQKIGHPVQIQDVFCSEAVCKWWAKAGANICPGLKYPMPDDIAKSDQTVPIDEWIPF